ncbi:hypothetical protein IWX90DRAFT_419611 [Phyllosticta citrichinensis]|uniref:Uncharacterized protein n=1 Tax=Phyllosticta citrichinensis TaxID=1130410 RepID=A0ABR1Y5K3_9PEZI
MRSSLGAKPLSGLLKARPAARMFHQGQTMRIQPTARTMGQMTVEGQKAHTASQRLRAIGRNIPVEIYPLIAVMVCSLSFGVYSFIRPAYQDPTLRLHRRGHN